MTENASPSLDTLRDLFKQGAFDQAREGLESYLVATPDDADALALRHHLEELDGLKQINRAVVKQDWDQAVTQIQEAIKKGLTWDIELFPLADLLKTVKQRRAQAAQRKAQALIRRAEEAEESEEQKQARELYQQAIDIPYLEPAQRAQIQRRLDALRTEGRVTLSTMPTTMMQPDALMEQLVGTILTRSKPQVAEAVPLCAIPFWFDQELLSALRESDDGLDEKILARMARFSFVQQDSRGRYTFSQDVRHYLLTEWNKDQEGFVQANRRAQGYFRQTLEASIPKDEREKASAESYDAVLARALTDAAPEVGELAQNYLYHTLAVDGDAGIVLLRQLFHAADEAHRLALAERYLEVANEQRSRLNPGQRAHIDYMRGLLDQLQGKWEASRNLFERMLSREGLPSPLQARVRRALGNTLVQEQQWVEAIELHQIALEDFQSSGDTLETGLTMISLGRAHLDLALNTWGGGDTFDLDQGRLDRIQNLIMLIGRLPIIVYLMIFLGVRALLPVILRVGRDMDWLIARLFVTAARWLRRAETTLRPLGDQEALGRVEENLAWLYLSLGHYGRAETLYRCLLTREGATVGEYRAARARLSLAQALTHQGSLAEARELLEWVLPVFIAYQHKARIAQTYTTYAQTYALEGQPASAVGHYQQAAELYRQIGDIGGMTEVVEQMRLLCDLPQTEAAVRETIDHTADQTTHRLYPTRFGLPLLYIFQFLALVGLVGVFLFSLFTSVQVQSGTEFSVGQALLSSQQDANAPFDPIIGLVLTPQLQPNLKVDFVFYSIVVLIAIYLILYTLVGLWLTLRTSLHTLQEGQRLDLTVGPEGVGQGTGESAESLRITWERVAALLLSDRSLFRRPIAFFSRFVLFAEEGAIRIDWQTRRYRAARDFVLAHLQERRRQADHPPIPTYQFGFSIFYSRSGWLFVGTLVIILAFLLAAQVAHEALMTRLEPLPYALADLHGLLYLGLLIPAAWWLAVQPLRERIFLKPHTRRVWLTGLVGLLLFLFTYVNQKWFKLPLGQPNVALALSAAFLVGLAAYYAITTRHWAHIPFRKGDHVYTLPVRLVSGIAAVVIIALSLLAAGREVVAYHYRALGNLNRQRAAEAEDPARAQELYERAASFYARSIDMVGDDAELYHSKGLMLLFLDQYEEAAQAIEKAIEISPQTGYFNSLAAAYTKWAKTLQDAGDLEIAREYYERAYDNYSTFLENSAGDQKSAYLSRALVSTELGAIYVKLASRSDQAGDQDLAAEQRQSGAEQYVVARADYTKVLELEPDDVKALSARGLLEYELGKAESDPDKRLDALNRALTDLERVAQVAPEQPSNWVNLGQAHFAVGTTFNWWDESLDRNRTACAESVDNPRSSQEAEIYKQKVLEAIAAFERATALDPNDANNYNVLGRLHFNLINCPGVDNQEMYLEMIDDFTAALELEPDNLDWRERRAKGYYVLIDIYGQDYYPEIIADYEALVAVEPNADWYWFLGFLYRTQGEMDKAVQAYAKSIELDPDNYEHQALLGWHAYNSGDYQLSIQASQTAIMMDPTEPRPFFNWGLALVAAGEAEQARQAYDQGIEVTNALFDTEIAISRYDEALGDLGDVREDPAGVADALRARLTFKKALVHVRSGNLDEAESTYREGIALAGALTDQRVRRELYDEAIDDLKSVDGEPRVIARLTMLLETARER